MRRLGILLGTVVLAGAALATANATTTANRVLCHRTASATNPYVKVVATNAQVRAHGKHAADIVPVRGACPKTVLGPTSGGVALTVALVGETEQPAGDPVATGTATVRLRAGQGQLCYQLAATNLPTAAAAHIHRGGAGVTGAVVVPLRTPNASGAASGCAPAARPLVAQILAAPQSFYVNVHTAEFPGGAIRGQLAGTSADSFGTVKTLQLAGTTEPNAKGVAALRIRKDAGLVCYRLTAEQVTLPTTGAHIHRGAAGANGPVVVPFTPPGASGVSSGCAAAAATVIDELVANPAGFYVNVHTTEHPAGAMRAQLG